MSYIRYSSPVFGTDVTHPHWVDGCDHVRQGAPAIGEYTETNSYAKTDLQVLVSDETGSRLPRHDHG